MVFIFPGMVAGVVAFIRRTSPSRYANLPTTQIGARPSREKPKAISVRGVQWSHHRAPRAVARAGFEPAACRV